MAGQQEVTLTVKPEISPELEVLLANASLGRDAIEKINAGAGLVYALYHLPVEKVRALLDGTTPGFFDAYNRAQAAFSVRSRS
ncbi:hypothetical protein Q0Z83_060140 [Actinoplanes sichuanensis]|uniref:Uncharacterized protein n=1 Tax=Actinoplanes sichuanensis TaxID=512349 RepID=A0ABW4A6F4_9ACTN|nr:hypothetical protein [Actinoplanes sichuanensis]BEL07823.1 hypothetical protein Q0Z83_060140 [Actinoplanes sichuanensis]